MKTAFFIHLLVYALVNTALVLAHLAGVSQRWHPGPLLGWGVGLAIHGIVTFINLHSDGLRERMVANEVERLKARQ